jgi:hypothetical protein
MRKAGAKARRTALVALGLAALALGGGAEVLAGKNVHARMTIKINREPRQDTFRGRVDAKDPVCERGRKVKLIAQRPDESKFRAGTAKTNRKGKWKFVPPPAKGGGYFDEGTRYAEPGEYRAKTRQIRAGGLSCRAAKAGPIHVG